jgi:hypothetical protein
MIVIIIFFDILDHITTFKLSPKRLFYKILYFILESLINLYYTKNGKR